jgi:hypothetical protein
MLESGGIYFSNLRWHFVHELENELCLLYISSVSDEATWDTEIAQSRLG